MICDRCGVANRTGRIICVQCLGPLLNGAAPAAQATCAEHPDTAATGKCITCKKLVCDACGGVVNNRGVYCIDHTPVLTTAGRASPGMNPLLAGGAGAGMPGATARKTESNTGLILVVAGLLALILAVVALLVWPGFLKSEPVPAGSSLAGPGFGGASPYPGVSPGGAYPGPGGAYPGPGGAYPGPGGAYPGPGGAYPGPGGAYPGPGGGTAP
jgi:hypothetical protein